jgi:pyrrolysine biosynthesis protein PylC
MSSSKTRSDALFAVLAIPAPKPWPFCGYPLTVKPATASGSKGVCCFDDADQFERWLASVERPESWVKQEFLSGPSYSIEVIGDGGQYRTFEITELEMDAGFDCKRVTAPVPLSNELAAALEDTALTLARSLRLTGIMDVEVILHQSQLKVLEIDARFPSQTPTVVYHSSGINLVEALWHGGRDGVCSNSPATARGVVYEHILVQGESLSVCGEHIMAGAGPLSVHHNFFGAQEALTNYRPGRTTWVATLIMVGQDLCEAISLREKVIANIRQSCGITTYADPVPPPMPERKQHHPVTV